MLFTWAVTVIVICMGQSTDRQSKLKTGKYYKKNVLLHTNLRECCSTKSKKQTKKRVYADNLIKKSHKTGDHNQVANNDRTGTATELRRNQNKTNVLLVTMGTVR